MKQEDVPTSPADEPETPVLDVDPPNSPHGSASSARMVKCSRKS